MRPFSALEAKAVPIDIANCDTDQIIPARFLRRPGDDPDYARFLFHDLRFDAAGATKGFILDRDEFRDARIIVADANWGCGSSREDAVTALLANHIRVVVAPSMADIHYANCVKNGVLPVRLDARLCASIRLQLHRRPGARIRVDLKAQTLVAPDGASHRFDIDPADKHRLLNGLDEVAATLELEAQIVAFEQRRRDRDDWRELPANVTAIGSGAPKAR